MRLRGSIKLFALLALLLNFGALAVRPTAANLAPGAVNDVFVPLALTAPTIDLAIEGLEVTQSVQNPSNGLPLVADRPTLVRVYAHVAGGESPSSVTVTLTGTRDGAALPPITIGPRAVPASPSRVAYGSTFNTLLPQAWRSGQVNITARIDAANALAAMGPAGRDVLIGQIFKHPEALHALERTAARRTAMLPSLRSLTQMPRIDDKAQATVIDAVRAVESGRAAAADRALLDCLESDSPAVRQWASGIVGESGLIARAGPVTQARVLSLMTQPRFAPVVRMPLVAAPPAPADPREWVMPPAGALSAMTAATQETSAPPSDLAWWATGGFAVAMAFGLKRLARGDHGQGVLEAQLLDDDDDDDDDADNHQAPGMAA
jgi:hypothetical protein